MYNKQILTPLKTFVPKVPLRPLSPKHWLKLQHQDLKYIDSIPRKSKSCPRERSEDCLRVGRQRDNYLLVSIVSNSTLKSGLSAKNH